MATEPIVPAPSTSLQPLADIVARAPEDQEPAPGFLANLHGENVEVTAVLQRTAVVAQLRDRWTDKQVVPLTDVLVDPATITWRPKAIATGFQRRRYNAAQREAMRAASDRRARADQARRAAAQADARPAAAPQRNARPAPPDAGAASRPAAAVASHLSMTASVAPAPPRPAASDARLPADGLAAELRRARERIAELEAELEHHRAVARDVLRRVDLAVGVTRAA